MPFSATYCTLSLSHSFHEGLARRERTQRNSRKERAEGTERTSWKGRTTRTEGPQGGSVVVQSSK